MANSNDNSANIIDPEILKDFQTESKSLIEELVEILDRCEGNFSKVKDLELYGQTVDRIMGGAKSLAMEAADPNHFIHKIGDYSALCKAVSYKASQIKDNAQFYEIAVALLQDATEVLADMIEKVDVNKSEKFRDLFSQTFLDRLKWISSQFGAGYRATVETKSNKPVQMNQSEIDDLMKKLGIG